MAFRRNQTLRDVLVHAQHSRNESETRAPQINAAMLQKNMASSHTLTNEKTKVTVKTVEGNATTRNVIYAAKCKKCKLIYVGYTTQQLNERFNIHRSDIVNHPERSELPRHFSENPTCEFERDLELHILQKNKTGFQAILEAEEDKWIIRLNTLAPNGMNGRLNEYGIMHRKLFS